MRISTNTIYETGTNLMLQQQDTLIKTQQQLSTGRRFCAGTQYYSVGIN